MADQKKQESHAGFYMLMACVAVAILGAGYWWYSSNTVEADQNTTAQLNQPTRPPKDAAKKTGDATPSANAAPASSSDNK